MNKKKTRAQVIKKRILSIGLKVSLFFLMLLFISSVIISIPAVQTKIINKLSETAFSKIKHKVQLEYINIRWFDTVLIKGLLVYDAKNEQMIKADRVILDFKFTELVTKNSINLDKAILQGASVDMLKNGPEGQFNLNYFIDEIKAKLIKKKEGKKGKIFNADKIILTNSRFRMFRDDRQVITNRFDQYHFTVKNLETSITRFMIDGTNISFDVNELQCIDSVTQLEVKELKTHFLYTRQSMVFQNMDLKAGNSTISQSMVFNYLQPSSVKTFEDSVNITANVKKSLIYSKDLGLFVPALKKYNAYYRFDGFIEGPVNRISADNITLQFGYNSKIQGYINTYGLPNITETFINAKINSGKIDMDDLASYMSGESFEKVKKFGNVNLEGEFSGFIGDFVSNAAFQTGIGEFETDINLKLGKVKNAKPTYSGKLVTRNFDLGIFLSDTLLYQTLDLNGQINGTGFTKEEAKFDLVSTIDRIGIKGYEYKNIKTDAVLAEQFFNGNLIIDDPNLQFSGNMKLDLKKGSEIIQIEANLGKANLDTMKLSDKPAFLSSSINVDMRGLNIDNMLGDIYLDNTYFKYGERDVFVDRLLLSSDKDSLSRTLKINSPNIDLDVFGDFDYSTFFKDAADVYNEYRLIIRNNSEEIAAYQKSHHRDSTDNYYLDFDINLKGINPIVNLLIEDFYISDSTKITGEFAGGLIKLISVKSQIDTFSLFNYTFEKTVLNINSQKSSDTTLVYGTYNLSSEKQQIGEKIRTENLEWEANWNGNKIDFLFDIYQADSTNYAKTKGQIVFLPDLTKLSLRDAEINLINKIWKIHDENSITVQNKKYDIKNLSIFYDNQKITFSGKISDNPKDILFISIVDFDIENINPLVSKRLDGVFNGMIDIKDYYNNRQINSRINIRDLTINEFLVGNLIGSSEFNHQNNDFDVNVNVNRKGVQTMLIEGTVNPAQVDNQLNLDATLSDANINLIEPFFDNFISSTAGKLSGEVKISGAMRNPVLKGEVTTKNGEFTLDYLNTHFRLDGTIVLENNSINFRDFRLTDNFQNKGTISGRIGHKGFKELEYDFKGDLEKFLVLNTSSKDNNLYYGTAYATGDFRIFGKEKILNITANATTEKGTKFFIPLAGSSEVVKEDFINFISVKDTAESAKLKSAKKVGLSGINLNFDLDITPDAYCEIIFDLTAGDIIRGRGSGKLNLQINTKGDFNMFGDYVIDEGGYNFTLYNIINKEFEIEPNSKISWIGDPYAAILDIRANYKQMASLIPILRVSEETVQNHPELNRKYPAKVLLDITGNLLAPEIEFDIEVDDYPKNLSYDGVSIETQMAAFKNKLATDEQELKRQVFSLIILKSFSLENAFNTGGSVGRSVSEFISNQISYWITQFDENLEVDVDLGSLDNDAFNTFQLRMSYSFLNGRLRVTRAGGFSDQTAGTNVASVLGDWTVEYMLSADGKLRTKIYNKTEYDRLNPGRSTATSAGFSLVHTQSFDKIKNIFKSARDKNKPTEKDNNPPTELIQYRSPAEEDSLINNP